MYVAANNKTPPNRHLNVREQDIATPSGRHLTLVNKANMVRQVSELFPERNEARGHITSLHPLRPENAPDPWEAIALQAFEQGKTEASEIQQVDGQPYMRLMRPLVAEQGCLKCHAPQGFSPGSIQGGISVTIPMALLQQAYSREISGFLLANGFIWIIGLGTIGAGSRKIIKKTSDMEASENKIRSLVNSIREIIFQLDVSGNWLFLNPAWTDLTGHAVADNIGTSCLLHQHPDDRQPTQDEFRSLLDGSKQHCKREIRFISKQGDVRWFEAHARPVLDAGKIAGVHGTLVDISERKKSEHLVLEAKEEWESTFDSIDDMITIHDLDMQIMSANRAARKNLGIKATGTGETASLGMCHDYVTCRMPGEDLPPCRQVASGKSHTLEFFDPHLNMFLECRTVQKVDHNQSVSGYVHILRNITERKASEELFKNTFDQAAVGICHVALRGRFLRVNQRLCTMLGYSEQELRATTFQEVIFADDVEASRKLYRQLVEDGVGTAAMEKRYIRKDGSLVWVNQTVSLVRDLSHQPHYFIAVIEDISRRKIAETALQKSEKFLSTIIDTEPECIKLLAADGTIQMMNKAGLAMIDAESPDQVKGKSAYSLISPEYRDAFKKITQEVFEGKPGHLVFELVGLGGRRLWLDTHAVPLRNEQGEIVALLGITRDVTERRQAEEALRESEEHFHQIFDQTNDAIVLFRMDTFRIYDANPAAVALFGVNKEEVRNLKPWTFVTPQVFRDFIRAIPLDDHSRDFQVDKAPCFKNDRTRIVVSIHGKIIRLNDEYLVFCSIRDITEKLRLEGEIRATQAKLIHTNKMTSLGMLVSGIAHEVNNPNHYISVNNTMLADAWQDASSILRPIL